MKVAILGCGPTGMIAAHAASTLGHDVTIYSRKVKSPTFGAMYLHAPIPGVTPVDPQLEINITKIGTREGYAKNVYGDPKAEVSWDKFEEGPSPGWDLPAAYGKLWEMYSHRVIDIDLTGRIVDRIGRKHRRVFSTVPTNKILCDSWFHRFTSVEIVIAHGPNTDANRDENVMYYNGMPSDAFSFGVGSHWYRYSSIRGYQSWEYTRRGVGPGLMEVEGYQLSYGVKPLMTTCDCRPGIIRLGRFGKWDKHAFTHHSYQQVRNALLSL